MNLRRWKTGTIRREYYSPHAAVIWCHFVETLCPTAGRKQLCQYENGEIVERRRLCAPSFAISPGEFPLNVGRRIMPEEMLKYTERSCSIEPILLNSLQSSWTHLGIVSSCPLIPIENHAAITFKLYLSKGNERFHFQ